MGKVLDGMGRSRRPQGPSRASARTMPRATGPREENAGDGRPMRGGRQDAEGRGKARWEPSGFEGPAMISACAACSGEVLSDDFTVRAVEDGVRRLGKRVVGRYTLPGLCLLGFARWALPCGRRAPRRSQKPDANPDAAFGAGCRGWTGPSLWFGLTAVEGSRGQEMPLDRVLRLGNLGERTVERSSQVRNVGQRAEW